MTVEATMMMGEGAALQPVTHNYSAAGSGTETIPAGYTTVVMECWGATGASGGGDPQGKTSGGGAASGSYSRSSYSVSGAGGKTLDYIVASTGASSISSGTFAITTLSAPNGNSGTNGTISVPGSGGTPGAVASGGTAANLAGNAGQDGSGPGSSNTGAGGAGVVGVYATGPDGPPGTPTVSGLGANPGLVVFTYLP